MASYVSGSYVFLGLNVTFQKLKQHLIDYLLKIRILRVCLDREFDEKNKNKNKNEKRKEKDRSSQTDELF